MGGSYIEICVHQSKNSINQPTQMDESCLIFSRVDVHPNNVNFNAIILNKFLSFSFKFLMGDSCQKVCLLSEHNFQHITTDSLECYNKLATWRLPIGQ